MPAGRPRKKDVPTLQNEKSDLIKQYKSLVKLADKDSEDLKVKELAFARLIAEGFNQRDAYIEAFTPDEDVSDRSIIEMASRRSKKPSIQVEIERVKTELRDASLSRNNNLLFALDGRKVSERIAVELFVLATSPEVETKYKLLALERLGKMRHIDCFTSSTSINNSSNVIAGGMAIDTTQSVSEATKSLLSTVKKLIAAKEPDQSTNMLSNGAIDVKVEKDKQNNG